MSRIATRHTHLSPVLFVPFCKTAYPILVLPSFSVSFLLSFAASVRRFFDLVVILDFPYEPVAKTIDNQIKLHDPGTRLIGKCRIFTISQLHTI